MLVHDLDFLGSILGRPVAVCADVRSSEIQRVLPDGKIIYVTDDDTTALLLRPESGALAMLSITVMGVHADHYSLELFRLGGTIVGDGTLRSTEFRYCAPGDDQLAKLAASNRRPAHADRLPGGLAGHSAKGMALMAEDWRPAFDGGLSVAPSFEDCLLSLAIIEAAHRSSSGAGWVDIEI